MLACAERGGGEGVVVRADTLTPAVARASSTATTPSPEPGAMKLSIPAGKMLGVSMAFAGGYGMLFLGAPGEYMRPPGGAED